MTETTETKKFKVYHSRNFALNSKLHFDTDGYAPIKANYELVAVVHGLDLEQAFFFTNHVDKAWFDHLNVEVVKESRSTSVGDLVEDEDGQLWLCAFCGWEKVEWSDNDDLVVWEDDHGSFVVSKEALLAEVKDDYDKLKRFEKAIGQLLV